MNLLLAMLPEWILLGGALVLFFISLGEQKAAQARRFATGLAVVLIVACLVTLRQEAVLFDAAYRVDAFSQWLKLVFAIGYLLILLISRDLPDIREDVKPEYHMLLTFCVTGLTLLVSCIDLITLILAFELASFPLYFLVPMRRERADQRIQMESAIKYVMFGMIATGLMLFGMSYLYGMTHTTSIPLMLERLQPLAQSPLAVAGLGMMIAALLYKLAIFPFQFWTPDVYQGASHETTALIASLPKIAAGAVLVRFVSLGTPDNPGLAMLLVGLAVASMFYGNLVALMQTDLKRLLGFSSIAHGGYALIGYVTLEPEGYTAALFYLVSYLFMVLACFVVACQVSRDGTNVALTDLAGLHRRSPLLAATLLVGVFGLAGLPPLAGFMGKLTLLKAALGAGYLTLVILAVVNTAIAIYYYLGIIREAFFRDSTDRTPIVLNPGIRLVCILLIAGVFALGISPQPVLHSIASSIPAATAALPVSSSSLPAVAPTTQSTLGK
jgi:NADH-quinone oxidoreductase subunit N